MKANQITQTHYKPTRRRVGRGNAAGQGTTAGRGYNGQKSRTGANSNIPRTFTGGGTTLMQRLPKLKGFNSRNAKPVTVSWSRIEQVFDAKDEVSMVGLIAKGLVSNSEAIHGVKVVGSPSKEVATLPKIDTSDSKLLFSKSLLALHSR